MTSKSERRLDAVQFGKMLRSLRLQRRINISDAARTSGVPDHTINRLEKGEIEKPSFEDVVSLGFRVYGLSPDHMAALAGLYPAPEADDETFPQRVVNALQHLRIYLSEQDRAEQVRMAEVIEGFVSLAELRREAISGSPEADELPSWVKVLTGESAVTLTYLAPRRNPQSPEPNDP